MKLKRKYIFISTRSKRFWVKIHIFEDIFWYIYTQITSPCNQSQILESSTINHHILPIFLSAINGIPLIRRRRNTELHCRTDGNIGRSKERSIYFRRIWICCSLFKILSGMRLLHQVLVNWWLSFKYQCLKFRRENWMLWTNERRWFHICAFHLK